MKDKCFNRIISFLLAFLLVVPMLQPLGVYAADGVTVYLDPVGGSDENTGLTESEPVLTVEKAYELLTAGGTVVFLDTLELTEATSFPACSYPVTLTSRTGAEGISSSQNVTFNGETTLEKITMTLTRASSAVYLYGNGEPFTIGENVTSVGIDKDDGSDHYYFCVGGTGVATSGVQLTIQSGNWRNVFGTYTKAVSGNMTMDISGCSVQSVAACYNGSVGGTVSIALSDASVSSTVYGNSANNGNVTGDTTILLGDNVDLGNVYAGNKKAGYTVSANATVILEGENQNYAILSGKHTSGVDMNSTLVLKSGTVPKTPVNFDTVQIDVAEGKTLTLADDLAADSVTCAGTLAFSGAVTLDATAVTGTVNCQIIGTALKNQVYVTAPAGSGIVFPEETGIVETEGKWVNHDLDDFAGLVLTAPSEAAVKFYEELFVQGGTFTQVTPYATETVDGVTYYYFPNISGNYHYLASRSGYYTIYKNIYISAEEAAAKTVTAVDLKEKTGEGWEPNVVYSQTDEVLDSALKCDDSLWEDYAEYLDVPSITENSGTHQMTTQTQMEEYIAQLDGDSDNMYVFSAGSTGKYEYDIPAVIYTAEDLSGVTTLAGAADALADDGKVTVLYRAQMHGNEPGAGEGALAMLQKLGDTYGTSLLDTMNIVVLPRVSPDTAYTFNRYMPDTGINPNRDQLRLETAEMQAYQAAYLLFQPHVVIDGHERVWNNQGGDITLMPGFSIMNSQEFIDKSLDIVHAAFDELEAEGLDGYYYSNYLNERDYSSGYGYTGAVGTLYVLAETRGIYSGNEFKERRMVSHMVTVTGILDYVQENAATIKELVAAEKERIATAGKTYEESEIIPLDLDIREDTNYTRQSQYVNWATGEVTYRQQTPRVFDKVLRSRSMPTAYVLSADQSNITQILALMDRHDISYQLLPAGATLSLQQYTGSVDEATLGEKKDAFFADGAYVFPMNQTTGLILALLMEPDVTDLADYSSTLAQQSLVAVADIYRYTQDLNTEGTVDYTITDGEQLKQTATVYVAATSGSDENDGLTGETAVATFEKAYAILAETFGTNTDAEGTIIVVEDYTLPTGINDFDSHDYSVIITGKTGEETLNYTESGQTNSQINFNGETVLQNIGFTIKTSSTKSRFCHINANGNKLTIGEGVTNVIPSNVTLFLAGGSYDTSVSSTNLTVHSGNWTTIYAGGYKGAVSGEAKLTVTGGSVSGQIMSSYSKNCGSVVMDISGVTVSGNGILAGCVSGTFTGDVTMILGNGITAPSVSASNRDKDSMTGTVTVIVDGMDMSAVPVKSKFKDALTVGKQVLIVKSGTAAAVEDFDEVNLDTSAGGTVVLATDMAFDNVTGGSGSVDLNGKNITSNINAQGDALLVADSQTDDYTVSDGIYGKLTGTAENVAAASGYMMVQEDDGVSFHRLDMQITAVGLKTTTGGLYYYAKYYCDDLLADNVATFGIATKLGSMPTDLEDTSVLYSELGGSAFITDAEITGATMNNIISTEEIEGYTNDQRGEMKIYAAPYVILKTGDKLIGTGDVGMSLKDCCDAIDDMITELKTGDADDQAKATDYTKYMTNLFTGAWSEMGLTWTFENFPATEEA